MLKTILYLLLALTTLLRFASLMLVLAGGDTHLPTPVVVLTSVTVVYGVLLLLRRFLLSVHPRHFVHFFAFQSAVFFFNLIYVSRTVPLEIRPLEVLITGTVLDILVGFVAIYYCLKNMRRKKIVTVGDLR